RRPSSRSPGPNSRYSVNWDDDCTPADGRNELAGSLRAKSEPRQSCDHDRKPGREKGPEASSPIPSENFLGLVEVSPSRIIGHHQHILSEPVAKENGTHDKKSKQRETPGPVKGLALLRSVDPLP